jgi:hypothetical protein
LSEDLKVRIASAAERLRAGPGPASAAAMRIALREGVVIGATQSDRVRDSGIK